MIGIYLRIALIYIPLRSELDQNALYVIYIKLFIDFRCANQPKKIHQRELHTDAIFISDNKHTYLLSEHFSFAFKKAFEIDVGRKIYKNKTHLVLECCTLYIYIYEFRIYNCESAFDVVVAFVCVRTKE